MNKIVKVIIIGAIGISIIGVAGNHLLKYLDKENEKKEFENIVYNMGKTIPEKIPEYFEGEEIVKDVECIIDSKIEFKSDLGWNEWVENRQINIYVSDEFDNLDIHEQYEIIDRLGNKAESAVRNELYNQYPEIKKFTNSYLREEVYGKWGTDYHSDTYILTNENTYEYAEILDNYFVKNGKDVYVRDEDGNWDGGYTSSYSSSNNTVSNESTYTGSYDATLEYGNGNVLICASEDAMSRYMTALNNGYQGTIDEMTANGEIAWTPKGTKCNIVDRKFTKCQVKLLDGIYAGNTVWVVIESIKEVK